VSPPRAGDVAVLVVDDHPVVRRGLAAFLDSREGITVVGEAADGERAVDHARLLRPDVVVCDLVMPGLSGQDTVRALRALDEPPAVLVLTGYGSQDQVLPAIRAGAAGYLLKDVEPEEVEAAVRRLAAGRTVLHPGVVDQLVHALGREGDEAEPAVLRALTPREREVLGFLAEGLSNRDIARRLFIADKTVKTHVSNVLAKLGVQDRTQAALLAVRTGLGPRT
jgi:DNA-binding NarL/FixJ family response regulator